MSKQTVAKIEEPLELKPVTIEKATNVADKTVMLSLMLGRVTSKRKLSSNTEAVDTEIDRKMLHLSVDLFDAPEQRKCQKFLTALKAKIDLYTVPSYFRGGIYLVKVEAVEYVDALIEKAAEDFKPIVKAFADVVEQRRDESRTRLKDAFNIAHYPSREQVLAGYSIEKRWFTMGTPSQLNQISPAFFEREKKRAEESMRTSVSLINQLLAVEAKQVVGHLIERLTPGPDGKAKIFRDSAVSNISEFLSTFNLRNVGDSTELHSQIDKMQQLLKGVDPQLLRDNDQIKDTLTAGFKQVSEELDKLIVARPGRMIDLSQE